MFLARSMDVEIIFLGTGNAMPTAKRAHTAILLKAGAEKILVDCGEGTQRQLRIAEENPCKLTRILITHLHGDHTLGLPGLLKTLEMSEYQKTLQIYGPRGIKRHIEMLAAIYGQFRIKHEVYEILGGKIEEKEFTIEALPMQHTTHTLAYSFTIKDKRRIDKQKLAKLKISPSPLLAKLQHGKAITIEGVKLDPKKLTYLEKGKKITFILDTLPNKNAVKIAKDADLVICEAAFSSKDQALAASHQHLTSTQAATIAKQAKATRLLLTHISQRYEHDLSKIEKEARMLFKNTSVVQDFQKITI